MSKKEEARGIVPPENPTLGLNAQVVSQASSNRLGAQRRRKTHSTGVPEEIPGPQAEEACPGCDSGMLDGKRICANCGWFPRRESSMRPMPPPNDHE